MGAIAGEDGALPDPPPTTMMPRVLFLEEPAGAGDGAAGAHARHEHVHLPLRVLPDLRAVVW